MRMNYIKWLLLCLASASIAVAGEWRIPAGPVSGKWSTGDSIIVEQGAFVPAGADLVVEPGVSIFFESAGRFEVNGTLSIEGDVNNPVVIYPVDGWRGIRFHDDVGWNLLNYVNIVESAGLARQCVEVVDAGLEMNHCSFIAAENCLRINGGQLHARFNSFFTNGLYSKVVVFNGLSGFPSTDCGLAPGNIFRDNFIKSEVGELQPGDPIDPFEVTAGLWVNYCTNICLSSNEITVVAPLTVIGVRFGSTPEFGEQSWNLDRTIVYVESFTHMAIGVLNEVNGDLDVSNMTISVQGAEGYLSSCFFATRTAYIRINSTTTIMGRPTDIYFNTSGAGRIDANYLIKWRAEGAISGVIDLPEADDNNVILESMDDLSVNVGDSVWEENPNFAQVGAWGEWESRAEIEAFFALTPESPCIDRGDPELGNDPDNTRMDIGRFYYHQSSSPIGNRPDIVNASTMGEAYPNPFNPSTVLPFSVSGAGILRVTIWDVLGRIVYDLSEPVQASGLQKVHFQASNLSSGTYIAQAEFNGNMLGSQRLVLVK